MEDLNRLQEAGQGDGHVLREEGDAVVGVEVVLVAVTATHPVLRRLPEAADGPDSTMGTLLELEDPHRDLVAVVEDNGISVDGIGG